ncbi:MAG: histidine phosphatase family protein [Henriciella sp.]|nr:histidine phosphatase family protein [Henriciella sp.]
MKRLMLMRHAKTEPWTEGIDDHARALTPTGNRAAQAMAAVLKAEGWVPDRVMVSSARRTRETWAWLKVAFPNCEASFDDNLYLAGERGIGECISELEAAETLMVIGHNPGLHDLALHILREAGSLDHQAALRVASKMPTGAVVLFEAEEDGPFVPVHFKLVNCIRPKDLVA